MKSPGGLMATTQKHKVGTGNYKGREEIKNTLIVQRKGFN